MARAARPGHMLVLAAALAAGCARPPSGGTFVATSVVVEPRAVPLEGLEPVGTCRADVGSSPSEGAGTVATYHGRVHEILEEHCVACHNPDGIGPFSLESYGQARERRFGIRRMVEERRMPPWFAGPEFGSWRNDRRLPDVDRRDLLAWIAAGAPEGEPESAASASPRAATWALGREPDAIVQIPEPMEIPPEGVIEYQYVFTKTDFPEDRWLQALELHPTAQGHAHHVAAFLQGPDDLARGPYLTLWTGRTQPTVYPRGIAKRLPAGAWIMFELHYAPNGEAAIDRTELGLVFAEAPPEGEAATLAVATRDFEIPPYEDDHPVVAEMSFWRGGSILSLLPHMHRRGKAFRYELVRPDDTVEVLLDVPRYDHRWQLSYEFCRPLRVEAGDVLRGRAWYDNSDRNPHNPDPSVPVRHGPQGTEEMMAGFFEWVGDPVTFVAPDDTAIDTLRGR